MAGRGLIRSLEEARDWDAKATAAPPIPVRVLAITPPPSDEDRLAMAEASRKTREALRATRVG